MKSDEPREAARTRVSRRRPKFDRPMPFDLWWDYRDRPPTVITVLRAARAAMVLQHATWARRVGIAARFASWLTIFPQIAVQMFKLGGVVSKKTRRSRRTQLADLLRLARTRSMLPKVYYSEQVFRIAGTEAEQELVPFSLYSTVANGLVADRDPLIADVVNDKGRFAELASSCGVPTVPTLVFLPPCNGRASGALPRSDLIVKPARGGQGKGIEGWRWADGVFHGHDGRRLTESELNQHLIAYAARTDGGLLVQPRLLNHSAFAALGGDALSTTRVATLLSESNEPEIVEAFLRISMRQGAIVDNYHAGGWLSPVNLSTGRLRAGRAEDPTKVLAGPEISGREHPAWPIVAETAIKAHRAFPTLLISGWDIAMTEDGPVVIEANVPPGITIGRQMLIGGMAGTRMFKLLAWHAERWLERNVEPDLRWRARKAAEHEIGMDHGH